MLDQKDVELLQGMMESVIDKKLAESETSILNKMDEKLAESETSILNKMDEKLAESETSILNKMDEKLAESETSILDKMDEKLAESENLILEEMDRPRKILEDKITQVQKNVDELNSYYRITRLEHDNTTLLLKMIDELSKRVDALEKRSA